MTTAVPPYSSIYCMILLKVIVSSLPISGRFESPVTAVQWLVSPNTFTTLSLILSTTPDNHGRQCNLCLSILMPTHNASQHILICAVPVVDSPRVNFTPSNMFPVLGHCMRVSCVDVSGLTLSYPLMPGQVSKTLTLAYPHGSELFC
jgi:hypothetical protein